MGAGGVCGRARRIDACLQAAERPHRGINRHLVPIPYLRRRRSYAPKGNPVNPVSVFACEAQPIVLEGLAAVLSRDAEFAYLGSASTLSATLDAIREKHPDIVLVDQSAGLKQVFQFVSDVKGT